MLHRESDDYIYYDLTNSQGPEDYYWKITGDVQYGGNIHFQLRDEKYLCPYEIWLRALKKSSPDFETTWKISKFEK